MTSAAMRTPAIILFAAMMPLSVHAQISDDTVKIGVLTDSSGPASTPTGQGSVVAAQMAVEDFGGKVLGKPITVISADHQIKPDIGVAIARRWYDVEQVDLIVDVPVSAVGLAVQNVANEKKRMMIAHSTGTADFHGRFCSPYTMQWVFDTRALAVGTAVAHYLKAVEKAATDEPRKVAEQMRSVPVEDFFSRNGKLRADGLLVHDLVLVQVKKPEESRFPWDYYQVLTHISGEQAFGPPDPACPLTRN